MSYQGHWSLKYIFIYQNTIEMVLTVDKSETGWKRQLVKSICAFLQVNTLKLNEKRLKKHEVQLSFPLTSNICIRNGSIDKKEYQEAEICFHFYSDFCFFWWFNNDWRIHFKGYCKCPRNTKNFKTFYSKQGHSLAGRLETFYRLNKSTIFLCAKVSTCTRDQNVCPGWPKCLCSWGREGSHSH